MSPVELDAVLDLLKKYCKKEGLKVQIILLGGLALHHYGMKDRATRDIDAEVRGNIDRLTAYLKAKGIPSDLGEDISRWSVVSLPSGYRKRAKTIWRDKFLEVKVLHPADFIIAKLRRFTEQDIEDALFVAGKYGIKAGGLLKAMKDAVAHSPKDSSLASFQKSVRWFISKYLSG